MKRFVMCVGLLLVCAGCTSWESTTFKTLSASKAVIDQAKTDYRNNAIPVNACSYAIINQVTAADSLAVNAFEVYEQEKQAKAAATVLADQQAVVEGELVQLAPLIADIALLKTNPTAACAGVKTAASPATVSEISPFSVPVDPSKPYTCKAGWTKTDGGGCSRQTSDGCNTTTWYDNGYSTSGVSTAMACRETQTALIQGGKL